MSISSSTSLEVSGSRFWIKSAATSGLISSIMSAAFSGSSFSMIWVCRRLSSSAIVSAAVSSSSEPTMDCRSAGDNSSIRSARSAGCNWERFSLDNRSLTRRRGRVRPGSRIPTGCFAAGASLARAGSPWAARPPAASGEGARQPHVNLRDAQFGVAVGALIRVPHRLLEPLSGRWYR